MYLSVFVFFFFKQKTAYEMRISDWSSDVCSSDLRRYDAAARGWREPWRRRRRRRGRGRGSGRSGQRLRDRRHGFPCRCKILSDRDGPFENEKRPRRDQTEADEMVHGQRSEEHTSELQSLMRISYAVFSLKKNRRRKVYNNTVP